MKFLLVKMSTAKEFCAFAIYRIYYHHLATLIFGHLNSAELEMIGIAV